MAFEKPEGGFFDLSLTCESGPNTMGSTPRFDSTSETSSLPVRLFQKVLWDAVVIFCLIFEWCLLCIFFA